MFKLLHSDRFKSRLTYKADDTFQKSIAVVGLKVPGGLYVEFHSIAEEEKQGFPSDPRNLILDQAVQI